MNRLAILLGGCLFLAAASCDSAHNKNPVTCGKTQDASPHRTQSEVNLPCSSPEEKQNACANTPLEECLSNEKCRILPAHRFDTARGCRFPAEPVACAPAVFECDAALTYVKDLNGTKWLMLSGGCMPEGWERFQENNSEQEAASGPLCN